jgi:hypothetical protein
MQDPSLRSIQSSWRQSHQKQEVFDMVVNDLMVQGDRKWDEAKILSYFSNSNQTLSIPLTVEERNDSLIVRREE